MMVARFGLFILFLSLGILCLIIAIVKWYSNYLNEQELKENIRKEEFKKMWLESEKKKKKKK